MKKKETRGRKKKPPADKLVPVMTHLSPDLVEKLNQMAKWEERPVSQVIRRAMTNYLTFNYLMIAGEATGPVLDGLGTPEWVLKARQELGITPEMVRANAQHKPTVQEIVKKRVTS